MAALPARSVGSVEARRLVRRPFGRAAFGQFRFLVGLRNGGDGRFGKPAR